MHDLIQNVRPIKISVDWSYPTSPNAARFGYAKTGCWTVSRTDPKRNGDPKPPRGVAAFASKSEAQAYAHVYARQVCFVAFTPTV